MCERNVIDYKYNVVQQITLGMKTYAHLTLESKWKIDWKFMRNYLSLSLSYALSVSSLFIFCLSISLPLSLSYFGVFYLSNSENNLLDPFWKVESQNFCYPSVTILLCLMMYDFMWSNSVPHWSYLKLLLYLSLCFHCELKLIDWTL